MYYWAYTLDSEGNPLESSPIIVLVVARGVLLHGYDLECSIENFRLLKQIEFKE